MRYYASTTLSWGKDIWERIERAIHFLPYKVSRSAFIRDAVIKEIERLEHQDFDRKAIPKA